jgi:hypothetical protein
MSGTDPIVTSLEAFAAALRHRFELGVHTTEDAVRYTFFALLLSSLRCGPERLILEYPHPRRDRSLIDAWITPLGAEVAIALEFKFHRRPPEAKNRPRTMLAGSILSDLFKLADFEIGSRVRRVFVYVYGHEMHTYYSNIANGMAALIDLPPGGFMLTERFLQGKSPTFLNGAGQVIPCRIRSLARQDIYGHFRLRAYEVTAAALL